MTKAATPAREPVLWFDGEYAFLSNFWPSPFRHTVGPYADGRRYPRVEHAFQALKCVDPAQAERIRLARSPQIAKLLGRRCRMRPDWDIIKFQVMLDLTRAKYLQNADLCEALLATGDTPLYEGNTWNDTIWGRIQDASGDWWGENYLGRILMVVRSELRG